MGLSISDLVRWYADRIIPADANDVWSDTEDDE